LRDLFGTLDPGAARRNVGDADRQVAPDRDLAEQRFYRAYFRNRRIGEATKIILYGRESLRQVRISHRQHGCFSSRVIQYFL